MTVTLLILASLALAAPPLAGAPGRTDARTPPGPSAADYPSIQEAICANPGRMVYVPPGDYEIAERIRPPAARSLPATISTNIDICTSANYFHHRG
jgi:hypothetical protein